MKKIIIPSIVILTGMPGLCSYFDMGSSNVHYLQTLRQQRFRMEEFDDFKDFDQQKQEQLKNDEDYIKQQQSPAVQTAPTNTDAKLINDNGQIRIEY